jgi:hypothetical protein
MIVRGLINIRVPNTKCEHTLQYIGKQPNQVMKTYITQRNQVIITPPQNTPCKQGACHTCGLLPFTLLKKVS